MRVLYISYDGLTDALGQSQILAYQKNICSEQIQVSILSFEKAHLFEKWGPKIDQICADHAIQWIPLLYTKRPPLLSTLWDVRKAWSKIVNLQKKSPFDIVHCRGYISALLGEKMKREFGTKFIFDMRGWWPDEKKESGNWSGILYWPVYSYFKRKEKDFFRSSDYVVSLTEVGKREIVKNNWKEENRIGVIPTCTDLGVFQLATEEKRIERKMVLGFPPYAKIVVYSGALGGNYPIQDIFLFINSFLELSTSHYCLILSKDSALGNVKPPKRTLVKSVPYSEVGELLSLCDLGFIYYKSAYSNIGRCPTKLGEYWACGLVAFCPSEIGDVDLLFQQYPMAGISIPQWTSEGIQAALLKLPQHPDREKLAQTAHVSFSLEKGITFYKTLYEHLIQ